VVSSCRTPLITQAYFQQLLPLSECIAEDGKLVAQMLMDVVESNPKHPARAIRTFVNRTAMLRECGLRHFGDLLVALLVTSDGQGAPEHGPVVLRDSPSLVLNNDPALLTEEQATIIGSTFAAQLRSSHTPAATLLKVVKLNPVLSLLKSKLVCPHVRMYRQVQACRHSSGFCVQFSPIHHLSRTRTGWHITSITPRRGLRVHFRGAPLVPMPASDRGAPTSRNTCVQGSAVEVEH
jgi:hypothetical protein